MCGLYLPLSQLAGEKFKIRSFHWNKMLNEAKVHPRKNFHATAIAAARRAFVGLGRAADAK